MDHTGCMRKLRPPVQFRDIKHSSIDTSRSRCRRHVSLLFGRPSRRASSGVLCSEYWPPNTAVAGNKRKRSMVNLRRRTRNAGKRTTFEQPEIVSFWPEAAVVGVCLTRPCYYSSWAHVACLSMRGLLHQEWGPPSDRLAACMQTSSSVYASLAGGRAAKNDQPSINSERFRCNRLRCCFLFFQQPSRRLVLMLCNFEIQTALYQRTST